MEKHLQVWAQDMTGILCIFISRYTMDSSDLKSMVKIYHYYSAFTPLSSHAKTGSYLH